MMAILSKLFNCIQEMKKIFYYISAALLVSSLASCTKELPATVDSSSLEADGQITIFANISDEAATKTDLDGNDQSGYDVVWGPADKITLYLGDPYKQYYTYILKKGAGTKRGEFGGPALPADYEGTVYAVYGDNVSYALAGSLSDTQDYASNSSATFFPMAAQVKISNGQATFSDFRNIGGLLRLNLSGSGVVKEIKVTTDQYFTGYFTLDEDGAAVLPNNVFVNKKSATLNCGVSGESLTSQAKPFYIFMPKNTYTGVKIEVKDFDGHTFTKTLKSDRTLGIERAKISQVSLNVTGLTGSNVPVTWDTPEGTRCTIDGRECVVVNLGTSERGYQGKVAIATMNVGSTTQSGYGTYYSWFDAINAQKNGSWGSGWHMPTVEELSGFVYAHAHATYQTDDYAVLQFSNGQYLPFALGGYYDNGRGRYELQKESADFWGSEIPGLNSSTTLTDSYVSGLTVYRQGFGVNPDYTIATYKLPVRPFHRLPITRNTPVGAIGLIGGKEAMVVEINVSGGTKKVCVAIKNEGANSVNCYADNGGTAVLDCFGGYYTYAEAEALCTDGWYIPAADEWEALYDSVPYTTPKEGYHSNKNWGINDNHFGSMFEVTKKNYLYVLDAGYDSSLHARGSRGSYWSSTVQDSNQMILFNTAYGKPLSYTGAPKTSTWSVRLWHDMPK